MGKSRNKPNKKRLIVEIAIFGAVVIGILLWRFLPWLFVQPISGSSEDQYKIIYNDVMNYDFDKGPSENLEKRLDRALENFTSPYQYYYNLKAGVEYYRRINNIEKARELLEEAKDYAPDVEEETYVYDLHQELDETS